MPLPLRLLCLSLLVTAASLLSSCKSSVRGVPRNLPEIKLHDVRTTPPHNMARKDYPFDEKGDYITAWAAEGESAASARDIERWSSSHGGSVTNRKPPSPVKKAPPGASKKSSGGTIIYTIKPGDTLGGIAAKHKTTVAKIKAANGMTSDFIRAGKTLKIPR